MRVAVVSDLHVPYHDPWAVGLAVEVVAVWQPDILIYAGDMLDFYNLSRFDKDPDRLVDGGLQEELDEWRRLRRRFRQALPRDSSEEFIPGNHETRLRTYLMRNPELHGLRALELSALMGLDEAGITYNDYEVLLANGNLSVKHGDRVRKESAMSARAELEQERYAISTITGHTHRLGATYVTHRNGVVVGLENGCLCNLEPEYIKRPNWQLGMSLVVTDGDAFSAYNVPFLGRGADMKALVDGHKVRAS